MGQLEDMSLFVRIVEAGGISKASIQLGLAKSAVSRRLSDLEARLKVQLLNRNTRNWSLTDVGTVYYEKSKLILQDVSSTNAQLMEDETDPQGVINISIPMSFGLQGLSSVINEFMQRNPNVTFKVDLSDHLVDLVEQGIDIAIRIADLEDSTLRARHLATIRHLLVASPRYLATHGEPSSIAALADHAFLKYSLTRANILIATSPSAEKHPIKSEPVITANNADFLKAMVLMDRGIAYLPSFLVAEDIVKGDLVSVLDDYSLPTLNAYAIYPNGKYLSKRVRSLIDFIIEHCGENPFWDRSIDQSKNTNPI